MSRYIIRRLLLLIPTLLIVTLIVFFLVRIIPGDVVQLMLAQAAYESGLGAELTADYIRHSLGMDVPVYVQYFRWLWGVLRFDLGHSLWSDRSVLSIILEHLPISLELGGLSLLFAVAISLPVGIWSAIRQDHISDYIGRTIAIIFLSVPAFWIGTLVLVYPSIWWGWSPNFQYIPISENLPGNLAQFALPAFVQGMTLTGTTMRMTRTMMLEVLRQDYIRTAWAKGLKEKTVVLRHALKNGLIPIVSQFGLLVAFVIGYTVVVEQIFVLPGLGLLLFDSLQIRDYPVIIGINLFLATLIMVVNLVVDIFYTYLDPRICFR